MSLRSKVIRLAHQRPELRSHLLPLLKEASTSIYDMSWYDVSKPTRQNPKMEGLYQKALAKMRKSPWLRKYVKETGKRRVEESYFMGYDFNVDGPLDANLDTSLLNYIKNKWGGDYIAFLSQDPSIKLPLKQLFQVFEKGEITNLSKYLDDVDPTGHYEIAEMRFDRMRKTINEQLAKDLLITIQIHLHAP
jgi:hypothetical protein